jgi:hypothetical protein
VQEITACYRPKTPDIVATTGPEALAMLEQRAGGSLFTDMHAGRYERAELRRASRLRPLRFAQLGLYPRTQFRPAHTGYLFVAKPIGRRRREALEVLSGGLSASGLGQGRELDRVVLTGWRSASDMASTCHGANCVSFGKLQLDQLTLPDLSDPRETWRGIADRLPCGSTPGRPI